MLQKSIVRCVYCTRSDVVNRSKLLIRPFALHAYFQLRLKFSMISAIVSRRGTNNVKRNVLYRAQNKRIKMFSGKWKNSFASQRITTSRLWHGQRLSTSNDRGIPLDSSRERPDTDIRRQQAFNLTSLRVTYRPRCYHVNETRILIKICPVVAPRHSVPIVGLMTVNFTFLRV